MKKLLLPPPSRIGKSIFQELIYFLFRFHVGYTMAIDAGLGKIKDFPVSQKFIDSLTKAGWVFPEFLAIIAGWGEVIGGALIALGLFGRIGGIVVAIIMIVAAFIKHDTMFLIQMDTAQLYLFCAVLISVFGNGRFSLDFLFSKK
jgi:putative oxidoreductase